MRLQTIESSLNELKEQSKFQQKMIQEILDYWREHRGKLLEYF